MASGENDAERRGFRRLRRDLAWFLFALSASFAFVFCTTSLALRMPSNRDIPAAIRAQSTANYREVAGISFEPVEIIILGEATADTGILRITPESRGDGRKNQGTPVVPLVTPTETLAPAPTGTHTVTPSPTSTHSPTPQPTPMPTLQPSPTATAIPSTATLPVPTPVPPTKTPKTKPTDPPAPTKTLLPTTTATAASSITPLVTPTPVPTTTNTPSPSPSSVPSATSTPTPTSTNTNTPTPTNTPSPTPTPYQAIIPRFICQRDNGDGTYTALFGFLNPNAYLVNIPVGPNNRFSPPPEDRGQPIDFVPGNVSPAAIVVYDGTALVWHLDGTNESASNTPCP